MNEDKIVPAKTRVVFIRNVPENTDEDQIASPGDKATVVSHIRDDWYSVTLLDPHEFEMTEHGDKSFGVVADDYEDEDAQRRGERIETFAVKRDEFITESDHQKNDD